jgi:hypothetical protein
MSKTTLKQAAAMMDVPVEMAERAKELRRLSPSLADKVWRGEIELDAAFEQLVVGVLTGLVWALLLLIGGGR